MTGDLGKSLVAWWQKRQYIIFDAEENPVTKSEVTLYGYTIQLYNTTHISYP